MSTTSLYWHDYETFGADPRRDRPAQFAGLRTTLELEPIGSPLVVYCKPTQDVLPQPQACLITGITPQYAQSKGVHEAEFATRIQAELAVSGTCNVGYNSLRFDDEFTRHLLYRNFFDPYAHEWENGNSRWDLIDLLRLAYALRPEGIVWPTHADGTPSFRLEDLSKANQLVHEQAHDALSDVHATIALARLVRTHQPRLFEFYFALRRKQRAFELLDFVHKVPVLHVSSRYPASRGCLAMVVPLAAHPSQSNSVIVYDLSVDPTPLIELDTQAIADRVFTAQTDLPEGITRVPLKLVHANRAPALAPLSALKDVNLDRIQLDPGLAQYNLDKLKNVHNVAEKVRTVFAQIQHETPIDPELALYGGGFLNEADRRLLREVRQTPSNDFIKRSFAFRDPRYNELLFRYRARNFPETLTANEADRWESFRQRKLTTATPLSNLTLETYLAEIAALRAMALTEQQRELLNALEKWGNLIS